jgi:tripartite-type tricarboxylate transporter receptor subunit TctC
MDRYHCSAFGRIALVIGCMLAGLGISTSAGSADFPQKGKTFQMIVPFEPGGVNDAAGRVMAGDLEKVLGTAVVLVNKPGASTQIGLTFLSQAKPDGYTFGIISFPTSLGPYLDPSRKAAYSRKSFQPLAMHIWDACVMAVRADSPYKNVQDLVNAAKAKPKTITMAVGVLNDDHFTALLLERAAGVKFAHVTFAGGMAPALTALLGGKIEVYNGNIGDMRPVVKSGQVRILGVMDNERSVFFPDAKTFEEQGYKLYNSSSRGFLLPAGARQEIVDTLSGAMKKVIASESHQKRLADMSLAFKYLDPSQFAKFWEEYEAKAIELIALARQD